MKTWRRVDGLRARAALGAKSAHELATWILSRSARMAAFRCFWRPETSVLVLFAVRREQLVPISRPEPCGIVGALVDVYF